jgi:hypothetical protein
MGIFGNFCGEGLGEFAINEGGATAANTTIDTTLARQFSLPSRQASRGGESGEKSVAQPGTKEFAPIFNLFGRKAHHTRVELCWEELWRRR